MPNISKVKTKKKVPKPTQKLIKKSKSTKPSPVDYYNCLLTKAQTNWLDPQTGKKTKITACCKECKAQAPVLNRQREQEIKKLVVSYQQVGESLKKLLKPIN